MTTKERSGADPDGQPRTYDDGLLMAAEKFAAIAEWLRGIPVDELASLAARSTADALNRDIHPVISNFGRMMAPVLLRMVVRGEDPGDIFREMLTADRGVDVDEWFELGATRELRDALDELVAHSTPKADLPALSPVRSDAVANRK